MHAMPSGTLHSRKEKIAVAPELGIQVRKAKTSEFDKIVALAGAAGLDVDAGDVSTWRSVDAAGLLMGLVDGELCGAVAALRQDGGYGFVALHAVLPAFRRSGVGQALWRAAVEHLRGSCVGFDARPDQRAECADFGFSTGFRIIRYAGVTDGRPYVHDGLMPLKRFGLGRVQDYDSLVFGASRARQLRRWVDGRGSSGLGIDLGFGLAGYGVVSVRAERYHIGPLHAEAPEVAEVLLRGLLAAVPGGKPVRADVPEANPAAAALARRLGMRKSGEVVRMYAGGQPAGLLDRWFAVSAGAG